jgi:riboflavin biosynthesis pyrimidine reductase
MNRRFKVRRVRIDSGVRLAAVMAREGLIDEVGLLVSPFLMGNLSQNVLIDPGALSLRNSLPLELKAVKKVGNGMVWLRCSIPISTDGARI